MPPARPVIHTTNTIRFSRCRLCNLPLGTYAEKAEHLLVGHHVEDITLHRQIRKAGINGAETRWSTDWRPATPEETRL